MITDKRATIILIFLASLMIPSCERYQNGIRVGEGVLKKELFFKDAIESTSSAGNSIRTIQVGNFGVSANDVIIFTKDHCFILDAMSKEHRRTIKFAQRLGQRPELLGINADGSIEVMMRGGGFDDVGVVDTYGKFLWKHKREKGTSPHMAARSTAGRFEFYVADFDGLHKYDYAGNPIWKSNDSYDEGYVQIFEPDAKRPVIVTRNHSGKIRYWAESGQLASETILAIESYGLEVVRWIDSYRILAIGDYEIIIMDLNGNIVGRHKLMQDSCPSFVHLLEIMDIRGVPIKFQLKQKPYLAVLAKHRAALKKSTLSIISPDGQLIYQEMLNSSMGLNTLSNPDGSEKLLVGDGASVWLYDMKK